MDPIGFSSLPPHDAEAEAGALACVLEAENGKSEQMLDQLVLDDFFDSRHQEIFRGLQCLRTDDKPLNIVCLYQWLSDKNRLEDAGGNEYVTALPNAAPSAENFPSFLETIRDRKTRRAVVRDAAELSIMARDSSIAPNVLADAHRRMLEVHAKNGNGSSRPLNIWPPSRFMDWTEPQGNHLLLPAYLTRGELTTLIGQGGLGKTRLVLWQAICQILSREWCGLKTGGDATKWLFLGDENSIARWKEDLSRMFLVLRASEIARVEEFLRLPALVEMDDCDVWLGDPTTQARIATTIEAHQPGAIVADPLGNFAPGDIYKPGEMKETVRLLLYTIRRAAPKAAIEWLHHARTGRQNIAQGIGWDAANYASGGKPLFAAVRCQMNLMPGKADDDTRLVLSCAKSNNCARFEPRGLIFDTSNFTYMVDPEFDPEAWLADVEGHSRNGNSLCTLGDVVAAVRDGYTSTKALVEHLGDACTTSKRSAERIISKALEAQGIMKATRGKYVLGRRAERFLST